MISEYKNRLERINILLVTDLVVNHTERERERKREYLTNLGKGNRSGGPLGLVHPVKPDPRLSSAKSVKAMQRKSRSLILTDPTVEIASCRSLCSVRRLSKLPLILKKNKPKPTQPETRSDSIHESTRPDPARLGLYINNNSSIRFRR